MLNKTNPITASDARRGNRLRCWRLPRTCHMAFRRTNDTVTRLATVLSPATTATQVCTQRNQEPGVCGHYGCCVNARHAPGLKAPVISFDSRKPRMDSCHPMCLWEVGWLKPTVQRPFGCQLSFLGLLESKEMTTNLPKIHWMAGICPALATVKGNDRADIETIIIHRLVGKTNKTEN